MYHSGAIGIGAIGIAVLPASPHLLLSKARVAEHTDLPGDMFPRPLRLESLKVPLQARSHSYDPVRHRLLNVRTGTDIGTEIVEGHEKKKT